VIPAIEAKRALVDLGAGGTQDARTIPPSRGPR
jgi:hypothetical protein